jgi:sporadic carbohydrate cluster protein (TIGR04323 family)
MSDQEIFRGYIFSRVIDGNFIPQRVQNLVIKDFCQRKNIFFKLSATEYKMNNSFLMLKSVLKNMRNINGIVFYSLFMLPPSRKDRKKIFTFIIKKKKKLFFALEEIEIKKNNDILNVENIYNIQKNSKKL